MLAISVEHIMCSAVQHTSIESVITEKPFTSKLKKGDINTSLKSTETREELSTNCNPKVMTRCLSTPDATSPHHCLQNHRQYFTILS